MEQRRAGAKRDVEILSVALKDVKLIRKGAFRPFSENLMIRAISIPIGGKEALMGLKMFLG